MINFESGPELTANERQCTERGIAATKTLCVFAALCEKH